MLGQGYMNDDTLLHRQISPSWLIFGNVTSLAFKLSAKDNKLLSVYNGDMITAKDAWTHYTKELGLVSVGVMSVSHGECAALELSARLAPNHHPAHTVIDFTAYSNKQAERKSKRLTETAIKRGWQYKPDGAS